MRSHLKKERAKSTPYTIRVKVWWSYLMLNANRCSVIEFAYKSDKFACCQNHPYDTCLIWCMILIINISLYLVIKIKHCHFTGLVIKTSLLIKQSLNGRLKWLDIIFSDTSFNPPGAIFKQWQCKWYNWFKKKRVWQGWHLLAIIMPPDKLKPNCSFSTAIQSK